MDGRVIALAVVIQFLPIAPATAQTRLIVEDVPLCSTYRGAPHRLCASYCGPLRCNNGRTTPTRPLCDDLRSRFENLTRNRLVCDTFEPARIEDPTENDYSITLTNNWTDDVYVVGNAVDPECWSNVEPSTSVRVAPGHEVALTSAFHEDSDGCNGGLGFMSSQAQWCISTVSVESCSNVGTTPVAGVTITKNCSDYSCGKAHTAADNQGSKEIKAEEDGSKYAYEVVAK